jgi:hypothetical protein
MMSATRRRDPPHFLIRDDVLYIRPLEWNTTWDTFYGFPVRAWVHDNLDIWFAFPNGWVVRTMLRDGQDEAYDTGFSDVYPCEPGWYEMRFDPGITHTRFWFWHLGEQDGGNVVRLLVSVARREPYRPGDTWERPRYREDAPLPPGVGEERRIVCYRAAEDRRFVNAAGQSGDEEGEGR